MSMRTVLIVVLALVCGVCAVVGFNTLRPAGPAAASPDLVPVVVAAADIPRGTTVSSSLIRIENRPKDHVPAGALGKAEDVCERVAVSTVFKDEMVLDPKLAPRGAARGMAALLPKGMRAVTIQTPTLSSGVGGFILPGNKVDVLLTVTGPQDDKLNAGPRTNTLLQNVEILAVDQRVEAPADNKMHTSELRSVTLLVTPPQATKLTLGQNNGQLHLSLRNPEDPVMSNTPPATLADIGQFEKKREEPKEPPSIFPAALITPTPEPEPTTIRTLRGRHEGEVTIKQPASR